MIESGYDRCSSEPFPYHKTRKNKINICVLVYIDKKLWAKSIEAAKTDLFTKLNVGYDIEE